MEPNLGSMMSILTLGEGTIYWLLHLSGMNSEQKLRWEWLSLLTLLTQPPCTGTGAFLPGILSPSPAKVPLHQITLVVSSDYVSTLLCFSPLPLFKGQINPGPELTKKVIPAEMRNSHLVKKVSLGFPFGAPQFPATRVTTALRQHSTQA